MKFMRFEENKIAEAITRNDWEAVEKLVRNEKHLIDTVDEDDDTPFMWVVNWNAPVSLISLMIENASTETIEHKDKVGGLTILHRLAQYLAVSLLESALERTTKQINQGDQTGLTPLHHCFLASCSYEAHGSTALCLVKHGASLTIKDNDGKTPLDVYDANECSEYNDNISEKKKHLIKLLLEQHSVPAEVLARGEDAINAFKDEVEHGESTLVNARIMFLGKEGAGKTSCVNALLGKSFNENESSTDGIVKTVFQTIGKNFSTWEEQKDVDEYEQTKQIHEHSIAEKIAKKLKGSQQTTSKSSSTASPTIKRRKGKTLSKRLFESVKKTLGYGDHLSDKDGATNEMTLNKREYFHESHGAASVSTNEPMGSHVVEIPEGIYKKLVDNMLANECVGPNDVTCIWDHAGQLTYYATHRFFLTDRSSYGVVFSLLDDLDALASPRNSLKGLYEMTNLEMNIFWVRSIFEYAVLPHNNIDRGSVNGISLPTISLIATHKDQLKGTEAQKMIVIDKAFDRMFAAIKDTAYEKHVDRHRYAVDNTAEWDEGIEQLKRNMGSYTKAMAKTVPTNWIDFQSKVQEIGKTTIHLTLDEMKKIAVKCGVSNKNTIHVINYLNDIGVILYWPTNRRLKNIVITNIHMLTEIFTRIITDVKPNDYHKWSSMMKKSWHLLDDEGILCESLLRHLWKHELHDDESNFEIFIELMKLFGLIFMKDKFGDCERTFIVPTRMTTVKESLEVNKDAEQTLSIYVTPTDFLPDAVYNLLVVAFVDLMRVKGRMSDAELFRNRSDFDLYEDHVIKLGSVKIHNKHALKLEISRLIKADEDGKHVDLMPAPMVCMEVLNYLKHQLKTVYGTTEGIGYKLRVLCNACEFKEKLHFHELQDCLKADKVRCGMVSMTTSRFKLLFSKGLKPEFIQEMKNFQVIQSLVIDLGTRKMREFFLKTSNLSGSLDEFIKNEKEKGSFANMRNFLSHDKIFSPNADINTFDIAILMSLIRYCCGFKYTNESWDQPDKIDNSDLANLIRIMQYKNTKLDENTTCRIPTNDFDDEWNKLREIFMDLGVPYKQIEDMQFKKGFDKTDIEEMQNFHAVMSLVVDLGTKAMRTYFLRISNLKEKNVGQFLKSEKSKFKDANLSYIQNTKMFPKTAKVDFNSFDISIMFSIIRSCNHCFSFWSQPDESEGNILMNIIRIHQYRNTELAHSASARMSNEVFKVEWRKLTSILRCVGVSIEDIDRYKQVRLII